MKRLQALTFDLDDTLWDNGGVMQRTEHGHYAWLSQCLDVWQHAQGDEPLQLAERLGLADYQSRRLQLAQTHTLRRGDFTWLRERALAEQLQTLKLPRSSAIMWAAAAMDEFRRLRLEVTPHPEVVPLLASLGQRFKLAAITNGNIHLARLPFASHFNVMIAAGEMLAPKPDPRPFLAALARMGVAPSAALHVGDSWCDDVLPAQRLGMQVAWIAPLQAPPLRLPSGVHRLAHVSDLPALIERLAPMPRPEAPATDPGAATRCPPLHA
ncbi:HAD family hydrolase [Halomonas sediminis]